MKKNEKMDENVIKNISAQHGTVNMSNRKGVTDDHVNYDEELGEENVELVDSEWADFERALR